MIAKSYFIIRVKESTLYYINIVSLDKTLKILPLKEYNTLNEALNDVKTLYATTNKSIAFILAYLLKIEYQYDAESIEIFIEDDFNEDYLL